MRETYLVGFLIGKREIFLHQNDITLLTYFSHKKMDVFSNMVYSSKKSLKT